MLHRRPDAQRDGDDHCRDNRQHRQQQGRRELTDKGIEYIFPGDVADAHVSGQKAFQPGTILNKKRLIQSKFCPFSIDDLLGYGSFVTV